MKKLRSYIGLLLVIQLLLLFSSTAVASDKIGFLDSAASGTIVEKELKPVASVQCVGDENKYNHIFGNEDHNLSQFLASYGGDQQAAYGAVYSSAQSYVTIHCIVGIINAANQITVPVNGFDITVRGNVINGTLYIGTFFIIK